MDGASSDVVLESRRFNRRSVPGQSERVVEEARASDDNARLTVGVDLNARVEFRHTSVISGVAHGTIGGFGPDSYRLAILAMKELL